jgi:Subtilase family
MKLSRVRLRSLRVAFLVAGCLAAVPLEMRGQSVIRISVNKKRLLSGTPPALLIPPVQSNAIAASGFVQVADYGSRTVYKGPSASLSILLQALRADGYVADRSVDLDQVSYQAYRIDSEIGAVTPPVSPGSPPAVGLHVLVLDSYPIQAWLDSLDRAGIRIVQELAPCGYLVYGSADAMVRLFRTAGFVRALVPLAPEMKKVLFHEAGAFSAPRAVHIEATEEVTSPLEALLSALSRAPVQQVRRDSKRSYSAVLADADVDLIANVSNVYSIFPILPVSPSSERQGVLVLGPTVDSNGRLSLPSTNPGYGALLTANGIYDFYNTRVAVVDTGFNDGTVNHPDFPVVQIPPNPPRAILEDVVAEPSWDPNNMSFNRRDRDLHGTLVTSVVSGYTPPGARTDLQGYRYSLGVAPTVPTFMDKLEECRGEADLERALISRVRPRNANIVNFSFNLRADQSGCNYGERSRLVDSYTRSDNWLFTISAGNSPEGDPINCPYVRDPGSAKNGITVGATMGFVPVGTNGSNAPVGNTCDWNGSAADARDIPSFSVYRNPAALIKPDLVAPAVRITGPLSTVSDPCGSTCNNGLDTQDGVNYAFSAGTSFAAPAVAGAAAVVRRWFSNIQGGDPSPAMTKAMLINGARDLGPNSSAGIVAAHVLDENTLNPIASVGNIPDDYQGWGMLNLTQLLGDQSRYYFYDQGATMFPGATIWQKQLRIVDPSRDTHVTLVWTDAPSTTGRQDYHAVNDLDLWAVRPYTSQSWYGNRLSGGYSILNPFWSPDTVNNVEQLIIPANTFAVGDPLIIAVDPRALLSSGQDFAVFADNLTEPPLTFYTLTPCRIFDSRNPDGTYGGPVLTANLTRTFPVAPQCGVPLSARAISVNVTVTASTADGALKLNPANIVVPAVGIVHYSAGQTRANNSLLPVDSTTSIAITAVQASGTAHGIVDINGYFQ